MKCKNLLFLALASLPAGVATAQSANNILINRHHAQQLPQHTRHAAAKATAAGSRLIGYVQFDNNGAQFLPVDSITLSYSGNRGGDQLFTPGNLKYDNGYNYSYNTTTGNYTLEFKAFQTFDANNNVLTGFGQQYDAYQGAFVNSDEDIYTYDGSNNMLTQIYQNWDTATNAWVNVSKDIYTYDGNNNMTGDVYQSWDAGTSQWLNEDNYIYTYNAANKQTLEITQHWDATSSVWINDYKYIYAYDANNNQTSSVTQQWNAGTTGWVNSSQAVSTYNNNLLQNQVYQDWDATNNVWINESQDVYSNYTGTNAQTEIGQTWNAVTSAWANSYEYLSTYNSFGQITAETEVDWNTGGFWQSTTNDNAVRLYYESYNLAVNSVSQAGGTASIYPVPAQADLQIDLIWNQAQDATITIYDMQGRLYRQLRTGNTAQYHKTINVAGLAAGNYIINISGSNGTIVKQLTVAH